MADRTPPPDDASDADAADIPTSANGEVLSEQLSTQFCAMLEREFDATIELDDPDCLPILDDVVEQIRNAGASADAARGMLQAIGCCYGEVLVSQLGGRWCDAADHPHAAESIAEPRWPHLVIFANGTAVDPVGIVLDAFDDPEAWTIEQSFSMLVLASE